MVLKEGVKNWAPLADPAAAANPGSFSPSFLNRAICFPGISLVLPYQPGVLVSGQEGEGEQSYAFQETLDKWMLIGDY